jgi:hypothetical protein
MRRRGRVRPLTQDQGAFDSSPRRRHQPTRIAANASTSLDPVYLVFLAKLAILGESTLLQKQRGNGRRAHVLNPVQQHDRDPYWLFLAIIKEGPATGRHVRPPSGKVCPSEQTSNKCSRSQSPPRHTTSTILSHESPSLAPASPFNAATPKVSRRREVVSWSCGA